MYYRAVVRRLSIREYINHWLVYLAYTPKYICLALYTVFKNYPRRTYVYLQQCQESEATFQQCIINTEGSYKIQ